MADDPIPADPTTPLTADEVEILACDWSDYRKDYGVPADEIERRHVFEAFRHAWQMGRDHERRAKR